MWRGKKNYCITSSFPTHVIEIYLSANKERALAVSSQCLEEPLNMCCWQKNRIVISQPSVFLAVKQKEPCDFLKTSLMWLWKKENTVPDNDGHRHLFHSFFSALFCLSLLPRSIFFFLFFLLRSEQRREAWLRRSVHKAGNFVVQKHVISQKAGIRRMCC